MSYHEHQHHAKAPGALWESAKQACKLKSKSHHPQNHQQRAGESSHSFLSYLVKYKNKHHFVAWHTACGFICKKYFRWQKAILRDRAWKSHNYKQQQMKSSPNSTQPHQRILSSLHHGTFYIFVQNNLLDFSKSFHFISLLSRRNNIKATLYGSNFQVCVIHPCMSCRRAKAKHNWLKKPLQL